MASVRGCVLGNNEGVKGEQAPVKVNDGWPIFIGRKMGEDPWLIAEDKIMVLGPLDEGCRPGDLVLEKVGVVAGTRHYDFN